MNNKTIRLVVVDDNEHYVDMINDFFSNNNNIKIVEKCYDGEEAFDYISKNQDNYDAILLDLIMPKKDGIYVLEKMKKEEIKKPVVVCTSFNAEETISKVARYNPKDFIAKPIDLVELEKKIIDAVYYIPKDVATLENIDNGTIINVNVSNLPDGIMETDILRFENNTYVKDDEFKKTREEEIREKMERLQNLD